MPTLSDRQRVEVAIPAYLLLALTTVPGVIVPTEPELASRAEADIAAMRTDLTRACIEPFNDLVGKKQHALLRRVERIGKGVIAE
jgi:hypothetical protein